MSIWMLRGLLRRVVTTRYPRAPEPTTSGLPSPPIIGADLLNHRTARALAQVCPSHAFVVEQGELIYDVGRCTACGLCLSAAPDVVRPSGVVELATWRRNDLIRRIPIVRRST